MKKLAWSLVIVMGLIALTYGVQKIRAAYSGRWEMDASLSYMEGKDALARTYAQRLRWVNGDASAFTLAMLDVTHSISLEGTARDAALRRARHRLSGVSPDDWRLSSRMQLAIRKAFLDAELGDIPAARERAQHACKTLRASWLSYEDCMQSIAHEVLPGSRNDALPTYEGATLALKIHSGNPVLARFYQMLAMRYLDAGKAHVMRAAMIKDGVYTQAMQHRYCERAVRRDADICAGKMKAGQSNQEKVSGTIKTVQQ